MNTTKSTPLLQATVDAQANLCRANREWVSCSCRNELCEHHARWLKARTWFSHTVDALIHADEPREWEIWIDDYQEEPFFGSQIEALEHARSLLGDVIPGSNVATSCAEQVTTSFHAITMRCLLTGETEYASLTVHPRAPKCSAAEHSWARPFGIVGGIEDNPGVIATTAGTITVECCMVCGCKCETNTGVYNPAAQTYGNTSISFVPDFFLEEVSRAQGS